MRLIWLDYLRIIAAFAVVCTHVSAAYYNAFDEITRSEWWFANFINASSRFAVPIFVMISGCLLLGRSYSTGEFYRKRFIRIGPPLVFWSIFFAVLNYQLFGSPGFIPISPGQEGGWVHGVLEMSALFLVNGYTAPHLWYLSMLVCLLLFVPFINKFTLGEKPGLNDFVALASLGALFTGLKLLANAVQFLGGPAISWFTVFPWYLFYLILGFLIYQYHNRLNISIGIIAGVAGCALAAGMVANFVVITQKGFFIDWLFFANEGVLTFVIGLSLFYIFARLADKLPANRLVFALSEASFGIYLVHPVFIGLLQRYIPNHLANTWLYLPLIILLTFSLSFITITAMRKSGWLRKVC